MEISGDVVLDIENLTQASDKCSGSPKMTKALSRKGSCRMERRSSEEQEQDEASKKAVIKAACSHQEQLKQPSTPNRTLVAAPTVPNSLCHTDAGDGRRRFNRLTTIHPKKILLLFASMSSMGTMVLIYFTLAIYRGGGA